jgi:hypothetical protein
MEGSMNDRISQVPPPTYLGEEALRERYEQEELARGRKIAHPRRQPSHTSNTDSTARHSSLFRFGKSLAASFNLSTWKIWGKSSSGAEGEQEVETPQERILRERRERAERLYKELKAEGRFRDAAPPTFGRSPAEQGDGGVFRQSGEMSIEEKRMGRVYLDAPPIERGRGVSPASSYAPSSASRTNFSHRRGSLTNIVDSIEHLPRRIPSRKDLQKQQKLVKRVSDLEGKLDAARKQLSEALGEPVPALTPSTPSHSQYQQGGRGRGRFVPGALSTLPSERLLSGYVKSEDEDERGVSDIEGRDSEDYSQIGRAVTTDREDGVWEEKGTKGTKHDSYELEGDAPVRINKPLPKAPYTPPRKTSQAKEPHKQEDNLRLEPATEAQESHPAYDSDASSAPSAGEPDSDYADDLEAYPETEVESSLAPTAEIEPIKKRAQTSTPRKPSASANPVPKLSPPSNSPATDTSNQKSTPAKSKKRKGTFADNSGTYHPPPHSESSHATALTTEVKKARTKTSKAAPAKLQKSSKAPPSKDTQAPSKDGASNKPPTSKEDRTATSTTSPQKAKSKTAPRPQRGPGSAVSRAGSKLVKVNKNAPQSTSPPPSTPSFTGLTYAKPAARGGGREVEPMYSAVPGEEGAVPPMPKLPKSVRLPSGEVIAVGGGGGALGGRGHGEKENKKVGGGMSRDDSFDWEKDTF